MIELNFNDYPVPNEYHTPTIWIYPVADYVALEPNIQTTITNLQTLLASQGLDAADFGRVVIGGPMQGNAQYTDETPMSKFQHGVYLLRRRLVFWCPGNHSRPVLELEVQGVSHGCGLVGITPQDLHVGPFFSGIILFPH